MTPENARLTEYCDWQARKQFPYVLLCEALGMERRTIRGEPWFVTDLPDDWLEAIRPKPAPLFELSI